MAAIAGPSEIQVLLRTEKHYEFISDMIPIVQDTVDRYFGTDFGGSYPVGLKRPVAILIQQTLENPGAVYKKKIGDDETTYGKIDLSEIFEGFDDLIQTRDKSVQVLNLNTINTNLGL